MISYMFLKGVNGILGRILYYAKKTPVIPSMYVPLNVAHIFNMCAQGNVIGSVRISESTSLCRVGTCRITH